MEDSLRTLTLAEQHSGRGIIHLDGHGLLIPSGRSFYVEKWPMDVPKKGTNVPKEGAMAYDKIGVQEVGVALWNLLDGLSNGVGADEVANLTQLLIEAAQVTESFKEDPDAAGLHILGVLAEKFGDKRMGP